MQLLDLLAAGQPPSLEHAPQLLVGYDRLLNDWKQDLAGYVAQGGSLLRILSAPIGTGKTHLSRALIAEGMRQGFLVCRVDAAADQTDDDLALYRAVCNGLSFPDSSHGEGIGRGGLREVLRQVGESRSEAEIKKACLGGELPVPALAEVLPDLILQLQQLSGDVPRLRTSAAAEQLNAALALISGDQVHDGISLTRSLGRLRRSHGRALLSKLRRVPGRRDGRLWLETLLLLIPKLGFSGTVLVVDEHDRANQPLLDKHIVQLRRVADRLVDGQLPQVFALYLVLDDFRTRVQQKHSALEQRLVPILKQHEVPRTLNSLAACRDPRLRSARAFLLAIAERIHECSGRGPLPPALRASAEQFAHDAERLGGADTRMFVQRFAGLLLDEAA